MKVSRNAITVLLMASSILLLLVLQAFWLKGSYRDARESFRKETNLLFRNTVFALHDSMIQKSIIPVPGDSMKGYMLPRRMKRSGDPFFAGIASDTVLNYMGRTEREGRIEIIMNSVRTVGADSLKDVIRPLVNKMQTDRESKTFILRIGPDSLRTDTIRLYYQHALDKAGIQTPFKVVSFSPSQDPRAYQVGYIDGTMYSEMVRLSPMSRYAVSFPEFEPLILREITPEILFAAFVTLLTIGSFYVMYRNLTAQQRLMEIKNDFISNVTHELKTPVATVSVALEALKNFNALDNPKRTLEYLDIAQNELNRLTLMTDKILKTAVFEDKGLEIKVEKTDLDILIQQVLSSMKLVFDKRKTQLRYTIEGTDFTVDASTADFTNVLYNLIDNALKYSPEQSVIEISLKTTEEDAIISVRDKGVGIAPEFQKKVFEKFFRVPSGDIHNIKGYGLGLSYVASVVKSHGGEIRVESEPGNGSCFIITIPRKHED